MFKMKNNKKAVKTAQLEENKVFTVQTINKNNKEADDKSASEALMVMHDVLTDYNLFQITNYIKFSIDNLFAEKAQKALSVMQQFDTLRPNRLAGSTPARGDSAFSFAYKRQLGGRK